MSRTALLVVLTFLLFVAYFGLIQFWTITGSDLYAMPWNDPAWLPHWHVKNSLKYLLLFSALSLASRSVGFGQFLSKTLLLLCQAWSAIAFVDLQIGGNLFTGQYWDFWDICLILAGVVYAATTYMVFWRNTPVSDDPEPGKVYLVTRPPRNWLEFIGTILQRGSRGPVGYYALMTTYRMQGINYSASKKEGEFKREIMAHFEPEGHLIETDFDFDHFDKVYRDQIRGQKWTYRKNCFWMKRKIERAMKNFTPENQRVTSNPK